MTSSKKHYLNQNINQDTFQSLTTPTTPEYSSFTTELREAILAKNILTARTRRKVLTSLDDINNSKEESKRVNLRGKAINEIFQSEKTYLHQLELILKYFISPIKEKKILNYDSFTTIFGNIDTIYNVNKELLNELENNLNNVAAAFLKIAPYFKLYSVYAYDYRRSLMLLQELEARNKEFSKLLENQESRPEVSQKLSALLITPIQRVPRYRLLLKEVLAYTVQSDSDYDLLKDSLKEVERVAFHINSLVEEQENAQRLLELQRSLCSQKPNIVKPGRKLIKEGFVMKMAQNGSHGCQRYLILLSDIILYCKMLKNKPSDPNSLQCRCILPLHKCRITEIASKGVFTITCQNENLILYCEPSKVGCTVEEWIQVLQDSVNKCIDCRKTLRKASSSRKPVRKRNIYNYDESTIATKREAFQRKRQYTQIKDTVENISNTDEYQYNSLSKENYGKRFKNDIKSDLGLKYIPTEIETIPEQQEEYLEQNKLLVHNLNIYGLQKRVQQEETIVSRVREYFWGVGKSIKSIFSR